MDRPSPPERLKDLLGGVLARFGVADAEATSKVFNKWSEIVGDAIANNAEPTSLRDGVLRVRVESPTWATEVSYLGDQIRARANDMLGKPVVREVKVWTGRRDRPSATPGRTQSTHASTPSPRASDADPATAFARAQAAWRRRRRSLR